MRQEVGCPDFQHRSYLRNGVIDLYVYNGTGRQLRIGKGIFPKIRIVPSPVDVKTKVFKKTGVAERRFYFVLPSGLGRFTANTALLRTKAMEKYP